MIISFYMSCLDLDLTWQSFCSAKPPRKTQLQVQSVQLAKTTYLLQLPETRSRSQELWQTKPKNGRPQSSQNPKCRSSWRGGRNLSMGARIPGIPVKSKKGKFSTKMIFVSKLKDDFLQRIQQFYEQFSKQCYFILFKLNCTLWDKRLL